MLSPDVSSANELNQPYVTRVARGVGLFTAVFIVALVAAGLAFGDTGIIHDDPAGYLREFTDGAGYRLFATLDTLFSVVMALMVWSLANIAREVAPLRSRLATLAALGIGVGAMGGIVRLVVYPALAERYEAASPEQQVVIAELAWLADWLGGAPYIFSQLFGGAAFLIVAWALAAHPAVPRWLLALVTVPGLAFAALFLLNVVNAADDVLVAVVLLLILAVLVLGVALAVGLARGRAIKAGTPAAEA